jgi:phosphopantothenoylcysteine synthetase/decarboxylase
MRLAFPIMTDMNRWHENTILLGVTGGVAAYKAADLASRWTQRGQWFALE